MMLVLMGHPPSTTERTAYDTNGFSRFHPHLPKGHDNGSAQSRFVGSSAGKHDHARRIDKHEVRNAMLWKVAKHVGIGMEIGLGLILLQVKFSFPYARRATEKETLWLDEVAGRLGARGGKLKSPREDFKILIGATD